jgi:hypothetical protein
LKTSAIATLSLRSAINPQLKNIRQRVAAWKGVNGSNIDLVVEKSRSDCVVRLN